MGAPLIAAPAPRSTALAVNVPDTATGALAPVTLPCGMLAGSVRFTAFVVRVVGVPEIATVTSVALVRVAAAAVSPAGSPVTAKFAAVMLVAKEPLLNVYTMLAPLTA